MGQRTPEVGRTVFLVKLFHILVMLVWPVIIGLLGVALALRHRDGYTPFLFLLVILWCAHSMFILTVLRNYNLQKLAVTYCDFPAYLEAMMFLERFYANRNAALAQRINRTDCYLLMGDFDQAYKALMEMRPLAANAPQMTRMTYDYFWCRFYGELEDQENYRICLQYFRNTWLSGRQAGKSVARRAQLLDQELQFREMVFQGRNAQAQGYLHRLYRTGQLGSRYEFMKYCYFMGKLETAMQNYSIAKHWLSQTVSFGIREHMSARAAQLLQQPQLQQAAYAPVPPDDNTYVETKPVLHLTAGVLSMLIGFGILAYLFVT